MATQFPVLRTAKHCMILEWRSVEFIGSDQTGRADI